MERKKCVIIRSNALDRDIRIPKEITVLQEKYDITFLGWKRDLRCESNIFQTQNFEQRLLKIQAPYGRLILLYIPLWWVYIFFWLLINKWDIVHVINFDSVIPALIAVKLKNKKIIYEILDTYEDSIILSNIIRDILIKIDKIILRLSNVIILVDEAQINEFKGIPNKNIVIIYDSPPDVFSKNIEKTDPNFVLFYAGNLYKDRNLNLDKIIEAIKEIEGVKLIFAGYGDLVPQILKIEKDMPEKVQFIGQLRYEEVMINIQKADLLFVLRDPSVPINKYICGSTLFNAMMCGKPVLVNKGTSTALKVLKENCGLVLNAHDLSELREKIILLKNDIDLCRRLGQNGRRAYEKRYNWDIMGKRLLDIYMRLDL
jgi:glycosyltransferase involved in cell wall biosynthesis